MSVYRNRRDFIIRALILRVFDFFLNFILKISIEFLDGIVGFLGIILNKIYVVRVMI